MGLKNFKVSTKAEDVRDGSDSSYIVGSGIYPITIKSLILRKGSKNNAESKAEYFDLVLDYKGQEQTIFNVAYLQGSDGKDVKVGQDLYNKLCLVCGIGSKDATTTEEIKIEMFGKKETVEIIPAFTDVQLYIRVQLAYSKYEGKVQEKRNIKNVFRFTDKATAAEIANKSNGDKIEFGTQYNKEVEKFTDKTSYKDVTPEEVKQFIEERIQKKKNAPVKQSATKKTNSTVFDDDDDTDTLF